MGNSHKELQEKQNNRKQAIMDAATIFLERGTPVTILKAKCQDILLDQAKDLAAIEKMVTETPLCNVGVTVGKKHNLLALKIEQETEYDPDPQGLLKELEKEYGSLPMTMTIKYPNKALYQLYEYPESDVQKTTLESGIKIIKNSMFAGDGMVMLDPSESADGPVLELTHSTRIAKLPEKWIEYICTDPYAGSSNAVEAKPVVVLEPEHTEDSESPAPDIEKPIETVAINSDELTVQCIPDCKTESSHSVTPEDYFQLVIGKMVIDGEHPVQTVSKALVLRQQHKLALTIKDLFTLVYVEYSKTDRYIGASTENEKLMRFIADVELESFRDHHKELCCKIKPTGEVVVLSSKAGSKISSYLAYRMVQITNTIPKDAELKNVLKVIEVMAQFEGDEVEMFNRVGKYEGAIHYDLGNQHAVKVTSEGWRLVETPSIFRRYSNHKPQVTPKPGGRIERFFEFVNHEAKDRLLISVYMIAAFVPEIAHPVLYVYGSHGGAKSSMASKVKTVIDPSTLNKHILNNKKDEVIKNLKQYYVSHYDNISYISNEISDIFCTASTGGGMDRRKLYTDEESHVMSFKHCIILNGIKLAIKKPDLLDRSILIKLKRVNAKDEQEIEAGFQEALPEILGGVFDALAKASAIFPSVEVESFRMASFAKWGYAIAEALGGYGEQFLTDYRNNIAEQNDLIASANSLAHAVLSLMENKPSIKLTIGKAHEELKKQVRTDKSDRTFPVRDKDLRPYLEELGPVLDSFGIRFEFGKIRTNIGWTVTFFNEKVSDSTPVD